MTRYVRRSVWRAVMGILLLFALLGVGGILFEEDILDAAGWVYRALGLPGLLVILFVSDAVMSPVPPDALLVVIANSPLHERWVEHILLVGAVSIAAGSLGWFFGTTFADSRLAREVLGRFAKNRMLVLRYGRWAVALGAITPIPFSLTCWTAGMVGLPYPAFLAAAALRIPRFFVYYLAIAFSDEVARWLF